MTRNLLQLQKGISLHNFLSLYGTEDQCFDALFRWRWPDGFVCPHCGHDRACQLTNRKLQQCNRCHRQTSITAGTIFDSTKIPLTVWFQAIYFMTQDKKGISAMKLHRYLGISYNSAWRMRHKLMQVIMEPDREHSSFKFDELTDTRVTKSRPPKGRPCGRSAKPPLVMAVETNDEPLCIPVKHSLDNLLQLTDLNTWVSRHLYREPVLVSCSMVGATGTGGELYIQDKANFASSCASAECHRFRWIYTILRYTGNALVGSTHAAEFNDTQQHPLKHSDESNRCFHLHLAIRMLLHFVPSIRTVLVRLLKFNSHSPQSGIRVA